MHVIGIEPELAAPKSDALAASTATHSPEESKTFLLYKQQTSSVSLYKISWYPHSHSNNVVLGSTKISTVVLSK